MKRIILTFCCLALILAFVPHAAAANETGTTDNVIYYSEKILENGLIMIDQITDITTARSTDKTVERTNTYKDGNTVIAVITIQGTFQYDGNSVSVISKSITQLDTYNGWSFTQDSFTSSGGTITLKGTLKWLLLFNSSSFTMTLSCDKNGNIT